MNILDKPSQSKRQPPQQTPTHARHAPNPDQTTFTMASESPNTPPQTTEAASPPPSSPPASSFQPTWQLPPGIENHIEAFVLKSLIGGTVGAAAGVLLFRSGRGANAAAGAAFGIGCAAGSFIERVRGDSDVDPAVPKFEMPDILAGWNKKD